MRCCTKKLTPLPAAGDVAARKFLSESLMIPPCTSKFGIYLNSTICSYEGIDVSLIDALLIHSNHSIEWATLKASPLRGCIVKNTLCASVTSKLMALTNELDHIKKQKILHQWQTDVVRNLVKKNFLDAAFHFADCGHSCFVDVCKADVSHVARAIPLHCGLRICPDCARRESYRLLLRYLPKLTELLEPSEQYPDYFLKKLVLTTPWELKKLTAKTFKEKQKLVEKFLQVFYFEYFKALDLLFPEEIRRGRCDLKKHGIGGIQAAEFGARGKKLHWHILIYGPYMLKSDVWRIWEQVTGGECTNVDLSGLKPYGDETAYAGADLIAALQEIVKYSTKFTQIKAADVPHLLTVLKGNRRFRAFGVLYNTQVKEEKTEHTCEVCRSERENTTVAEWLHRCEAAKVAPADDVILVIENALAGFLFQDSEITLGNNKLFHHKARDSIEGDAYV